MILYVVNTCCPGDIEPCLPHVFTTEAEAEAFMDKMMRAEWETAGVVDEDDKPLPYPGDWREAQDRLVEFFNTCDGDQWGTWEITSHDVEMPDMRAMLLRLICAAPDPGGFPKHYQQEWDAARKLLAETCPTKHRGDAGTCLDCHADLAT